MRGWPAGLSQIRLHHGGKPGGGATVCSEAEPRGPTRLARRLGGHRACGFLSLSAVACSRQSCPWRRRRPPPPPPAPPRRWPRTCASWSRTRRLYLPFLAAGFVGRLRRGFASRFNNRAGILGSACPRPALASFSRADALRFNSAASMLPNLRACARPRRATRPRRRPVLRPLQQRRPLLSWTPRRQPPLDPSPA